MEEKTTPTVSRGAAAPLENSFPSSHKFHTTIVHAGETLHVPARRIHLSGGEPPLDVYDTSGPQGCDPAQGLPKLRAEWVAKREQRGDANRSFALRSQLVDDERFIDDIAGLHARIERRVGILEDHLHVAAGRPHA